MNEQEVKKIVLLELRRVLKGDKHIGAMVNVKRSSVNRWLNSDQEIPLASAILISYYMNIDLDFLIPQYPELIKILKSGVFGQQMISPMILHQYNLENHCHVAQLPIWHRVLLDEKHHVITGLSLLRALADSPETKIIIHYLNIEKILTTQLIPTDLTLTERLAIGEYLIERLHNKDPLCQLQWHNFCQHHPRVRRHCQWVADFLSIGSHHTYQRLKFIAERADHTLIEQLNQRRITINRAYQVLNPDSRIKSSTSSIGIIIK
jgi:hypothetical protein